MAGSGLVFIDLKAQQPGVWRHQSWNAFGPFDQIERDIAQHFGNARPLCLLLVFQPIQIHVADFMNPTPVRLTLWW